MSHGVPPRRRERNASLWRSTVVAALAAVPAHVASGQPAAADPPECNWRQVAVTTREATLDAAGRIWVFPTEDVVAYWPVARRGWPQVGDEEGWTRFPLPSGLRGFRLVTGGDELYVLAEPLAEKGRHWMFRRSLSDPNAEWIPVPLANIGLLCSMGVDADGTVLVGGERGEVFHGAHGTWEKQLTPLLLHNKRMVPAADGEIWIGAHSRMDYALLRRSEGVWRTVRRWRGSLVQYHWIGSDSCVVQFGDQLQGWRTDDPGHVYSLGTVPNGNAVAFDSPTTAWIADQQSLMRWTPGRSEKVGEMPFQSIELKWESGVLLARSATSLWAYVPSAEDPGSPGVMGLRPSVHACGKQELAFGGAVMYVRGSPCLYIATHTISDLIVPLGGPAADVDWITLSAGFGLGAVDEDPRWTYSYETAVLSADLNGDGAEEIVIATMYDGVRILRNVDNRRFVDWTKESGIRGPAEEVTIDADLLDADGDGDLDVFVATMLGSDRLYLNNGAGSFTEATESAGVASAGGSQTSACADLDGDGDTDVVVATWGRGLVLHENVGSVRAPRFETRVLLTDRAHPDVPGGLSTLNFGGVGVADFDGDGLPELVLSGRTQAPMFLRNRGHLQFEADPAMFPADAPDVGGSGVDCFDADGDGDLDVAITGTGGARFYENRGTLHWHRPADWEPRIATGRPTTRGGAPVDADGDGDLDWVELGDYVTIHRSSAGRERTLIVDVEGTPANRSAVGARVTVRGTGAAGPVVQEVSGGSGSGSHRTKRLFFTGLDPASRYSVTVSLPDGTLGGVSGVEVPGEILLNLRAPGPGGWWDRVRSRVRTVTGDFWAARWLAMVAVSAVGVLALALVRRKPMIPVHLLGVVAAVPVAALLVRNVLSDPGGTSAIVSSIAGLAVGAAAAALAPTRPPRTESAAVADLSFALRAFQHNAASRGVVDSLLLVTTNVLSTSGPTRPPVLALLREDLVRFENVVGPQLPPLLRTASSAGFDVGPVRSVVPRLMRQIRSALARPESAEPDAALVRAIQRNTTRILEWVRGLTREVDERLAVRVDDAVARFVASRSQLHDVELEHFAAPLRVRFPAEEMERVLDVLVENSVRARARHVRIDADIHSRSLCRLRVSDDGEGIARGDAERVFERAYSRFHGGTGYGLYYVKRTLARFGGSATVVDGPLSGACFALDFEIIPEVRRNGG